MGNLCTCKCPTNWLNSWTGYSGPRFTQSSLTESLENQFHPNQQYQTEEPQGDKVYSWDLRPKTDQNYKIQNRKDEEICREPGSIGGQQIIIENCTNCRIFLLDWAAAINIDDCKDCIIICGPVTGSIFMRDSANSTLCSASGQLRLRDCGSILLFVGSESEPIIESCLDIQIGPYPLYYAGLEEQFESANLRRDKLITNTIYDFTPPPESGNLNWKQMSNIDVSKFLLTPSITEFLIQFSMMASNTITNRNPNGRESGGGGGGIGFLGNSGIENATTELMTFP